MLSPDVAIQQPIDALLVLGRGIDVDGTLSQTAFERSEVAVQIARALTPKVVVFSGGRSWVQVLEGIEPPSEGGAMLEHAFSYMDGDVPSGVTFLAEETSTSTAANMANSKPLLNLDKNGAELGILSDKLHFRYGRVQHLGMLFFPDAHTTHFRIPVEQTRQSIIEELAATIMTSIYMTGVQAGNDKAIMSRQQKLERGNAVFRRIVLLHRGDPATSSIVDGN